MAFPRAPRIAWASTAERPSTCFRSADSSMRGAASAWAVTPNRTRCPSTVPGPTVTTGEPTRSWSGGTAALTRAWPSATIGAGSTVTTVPVAVTPRSNWATSWSTSVVGSTVAVAAPRVAVSGYAVLPAGSPGGAAAAVASWASSCFPRVASAAVTSFWVTFGNSFRLPPLVGAGFVTEMTTLLYCPGITVIVPAPTLAPVPVFSAVTVTVRSWQAIRGGLRMATGRKTASSVPNEIPAAVRTGVPPGIV